jgi:hypothetical protein
MGVMMGTRGGLDARWVNEFGRGMPPPHMEGVAIRFFGGGGAHDFIWVGRICLIQFVSGEDDW